MLPETELDRARDTIMRCSQARLKNRAAWQLQSVEERRQTKVRRADFSSCCIYTTKASRFRPRRRCHPDVKLDDADHTRLADADARTIAELLSALWEGV